VNKNAKAAAAWPSISASILQARVFDQHERRDLHVNQIDLRQFQSLSRRALLILKLDHVQMPIEVLAARPVDGLGIPSTE
jgi:hypothetical protein